MRTKTYPQDWKAYNKAQTREKLLFLEILYELTGMIRNRDSWEGRPPEKLQDMIFACCIKLYTGKSSRRVSSELAIMQRIGFISNAPHFNTVLKYLRNPELTPLLKRLIRISALPLREIEKDFTADASGFSTSNFERWRDVRTKGDSKRRAFKKAHVMSGTLTNVITHIEITEGHKHDSPQFLELVKGTVRDFCVREVSADMAYSSRKNLDLVSLKGGIPYIPFRKDTTGRADGSYVWRKMYFYFKKNREEFMEHYHKRSNAETVFSMIKRKFGEYLMTKSDVAQTNEILCKVLCHNIVVLIHEMFERNVIVKFDKGLCAEMVRASE